MKISAIMVSIIGCVLTLRAQTNEAPIAVLTAGNESYTNARITRVTPAYAVVAYDGGIVQIALSNLPPAYQQKYGYDPVTAAKYLADKKQLELQARARVQARQAAYQRYVASLVGTNQAVRIISVGSASAYLRCTAQTKTGTRDINIKNLPDSVGTFISRLNQLRSDVAAFENRVADYTRAARNADAVAPVSAAGDANYVNTAMNQRAQANLMLNQSQDMQNQLKKMKEDLAAQEAVAVERTTVLAYPTGQIYDQLEIWICTGLAGSL